MAEHLNYNPERKEITVPSRVDWAWGTHIVLAIAFYTLGQALGNKVQISSWGLLIMSSSGMLALCVALVVISWVRMHCRLGIFPGILHSTLVKTTWKAGEFKFRIATGVKQSLCAGLCNFFGFLILFGSVELGESDGVGFIVCFTVLVSVAVSVLNYSVYGENYTLMQVLGILLVLVGTEIYSALWDFTVNVVPVLGGSLALLLFTARGCLNKSAATCGFDEYTGGLLGCLAEGVIGGVLGTLLLLVGEFSDVTGYECLIVLGAGVSLGLGSFFLTYAVMIGNSGVSFAVATIQLLVMVSTYTTVGGAAANPTLGAVCGVICLVGVVLCVLGGNICSEMPWRLNPTFKCESSLLEVPLVKSELI